MSDLYLDLRNHARVVDFLQEHLEYADGNEREASAKMVQIYEDGGKLSTSTLVEAARQLGKAVWPARQAVRRWMKQEAVEEEWKQVLSAIRPSTAHLLERMRKATESSHVDEMLAHPESDLALKLEEREEIRRVRDHVFLDVWKKRQPHLKIYLEEAQTELKGYLRRMEMLRDLAGSLPRSFADEIFAKIERYEDRILFEGEVISMETLDDEIRYYTDQKEITPFDEG